MERVERGGGNDEAAGCVGRGAGTQSLQGVPLVTIMFLSYFASA